MYYYGCVVYYHVIIVLTDLSFLVFQEEIDNFDRCCRIRIKLSIRSIQMSVLYCHLLVNASVSWCLFVSDIHSVPNIHKLKKKSLSIYYRCKDTDYI